MNTGVCKVPERDSWNLSISSLCDTLKRSNGWQLTFTLQMNLAEENHDYGLPIYPKSRKGRRELREGGRGSDGFTEITARFSLIVKCLGFLCNLKADRSSRALILLAEGGVNLVTRFICIWHKLLNFVQSLTRKRPQNTEMDYNKMPKYWWKSSLSSCWGSDAFLASDEERTQRRRTIFLAPNRC